MSICERPSPRIGFVLSSEQFPVTQLVDFAVRAEDAGFDMVWTSDHFHPWQDNEGHASFAWATLAAVGQRTRHILLGTGVTCPSDRYRPPIVAEAFATLGLLAPRRVFLGVGAGEALIEVPSGGGWGDYAERSARLAEAVELIRRLWTGAWVDHQGAYYPVHHARLYDVPTHRPCPSTSPPAAPGACASPASTASQHGDGLITDAERDIPLDQVYGAWPASTDLQVHIQGIQKLIEGGVTHIFVHSPQPDQHQVIEFYGREVLPHLRHGSPAGDQSRLDPSLLAGQPPETQAHPS